ncbi:hypothetical protein BDR07DRAFT_1379139 [Suillus spraguei]|nr:hypothetical protein BDR07DRAFT_1379139 [Suillus spraguei]
MTVTPLLVTIDHVLQNALLAAVDRPHPLQHEKVTDILTAITTQPVIAAIAHPLPIMAHHQNGAILIPMSLPQRHLFLRLRHSQWDAFNSCLLPPPQRSRVSIEWALVLFITE